MAYITGTITDSNPGATLYALMAPALTTAGFTLVDTVVITTKTHKIWKSPAASNVMNLDWYLDVAYVTVGTGSFWMVPFEFYDPATDFGYRGPYSGSSSVIDAATSSRYGATGSALETNWFGGYISNVGLSLPATALGYWASITTSRVILQTSNEPGYLIYGGFYLPDPLYAAKAGAAIYPLLQTKISATSDAQSHSTVPSALLTRVPPATVLSNWANTIQVRPVAVTAQYVSNTPLLPTGPYGQYPAVAAPIPITGFSQPTYVPNAIYGTLRDTALTATTATVARGDTVTIGSDTWVLCGDLTGRSLLFKAV